MSVAGAYLILASLLAFAALCAAFVTSERLGCGAAFLAGLVAMAALTWLGAS